MSAPTRLGQVIVMLGVGLLGAACRVTPHAATSYYVAPSGDDARPCGTAQTAATPRRTVTAGIACLVAGDTLLVRAGTYAENLGPTMPSGTSWSATVRVAAAPGEVVWLIPTAANAASSVIWLDCSCSYIEFDGINIDGRPSVSNALSISTNNGLDPHHIRFQNAEVIGGHAGAGAINLGEHTAIGATGANEVIHVTIHGGGVPGDCGYQCGSYGIYIKGPDNLVERCDISDTSSAFIQVYNASGDSPDRNVIRNNTLHDLTRAGHPSQVWGIIVYGVNNQIINNVIRGIDVGETGNANLAAITLAGNGTTVWHNTLYHNRNTGILVGGGVSGTVVQNNIVVDSSGANTLDQGSGTVADHNLVGVDPQFVNAGGADFHLQAGSPAINAGAPLAAVTTDLAGTARPQGGASDIGAYEMGAAPPASVVVGWDLAVWAAGAPPTGTPVAMTHTLHSAAMCALAPLASPGPVTNPTEARVTDPDRAGQQCALPIGALVQGVPAGTGYTLTVRATGQTAVSAPSGPSNPFTRTALPAPAPPTVH